MFRVEMLPAKQGDCLWIEYGEPGRVHRILIDGGPEGTFKNHLRPRIEALPPGERAFDLVVVTHVDRDHVAGILPLLASRRLGVKIHDVWFNGWDQLPKDLLGPAQGEMLVTVIEDANVPHNLAFDGGAVKLDAVTRTPIALPPLPGGMQLTLLSPDHASLARLAPLWRKTVIDEGLEPGNRVLARERLKERPELQPPADLLGDDRALVEAMAALPFEEDDSLANGSSIAFLAEFEGKRCLFTGDAHPGVLARSLSQLSAETGQSHIQVDGFKLSHHGGHHNLSPELAKIVRSRNTLVSTNGSYYKHPDGASIARSLKLGAPDATLCFNYRSRHNEAWDHASRRRAFGYRTRYPEDGASGLVVEL